MGLWSSLQKGWTGVISKLRRAQVFVVIEQVFCSQHLACMFGAVGSVHGWERVGEALCHLAQSLLRIPMMRYVDDYFAPER